MTFARFLRSFAVTFFRYLAGGPEDCLKHSVLLTLLGHMVQDSNQAQVQLQRLQGASYQRFETVYI